MDEIGEVWVVPPPEEPELPAPRPLTAPPYAEHVGLQAAAEAAQDGVFLRHWKEDGRRGGTLPHKPLPFDPCQVSLQDKGGGGERERVSVCRVAASGSTQHLGVNMC